MNDAVEEPRGEEPSTSLSTNQPDSVSVTDGQQNSSEENEASSSSHSESASENENSNTSTETSITSSGSSNTSSSYSFGSSFEEDIQAIFGPETSHMPTSSSLKTFKMVGDNLEEAI